MKNKYWDPDKRNQKTFRSGKIECLKCKEWGYTDNMHAIKNGFVCEKDYEPGIEDEEI